MSCPHCGVRFGTYGGPPEVEIGAAAFCPDCDWNLYWDGEKWVAGDRNKRWWERES